jgi:ABC-type multidrug transport system permease subunit
MVLALGFERADYIHIRTPESAAHYQAIAEIGVWLLFIACLLFLAGCVGISVRSSPANTLRAGLLVLVTGILVWGIVMFFGVNIHSWTFLLLAAPLTFGSSGLVLILIGAIGFIRRGIRAKSNQNLPL